MRPLALSCLRLCSVFKRCLHPPVDLARTQLEAVPGEPSRSVAVRCLRLRSGRQDVVDGAKGGDGKREKQETCCARRVFKGSRPHPELEI